MTPDSGHQSTALSLENKQEPKKDSVVKAQEDTKKSVMAIAEDDDLFVDEGGDFFWLLQNVVWNALKSLFIIFVLLGIIWLVWNKKPAGEKVITETKTQEKKVTKEKDIPEKKPETKNVPIKTPDVIYTTPTPTNSRPADEILQVNTELGSLAQKAAEWHRYIDKKRMFTEEKGLSEAFLWMREVESMYDIPLPTHFTEENYTGRKDKINGFLNRVSFLLNDSLRIRTQVYQKQQVFRAEALESENKFKQTVDAINIAVQQKSASQLTSLVQQKAQHSKTFSENKTEDEIRQTVLLTMERYDKALRSLYEIIYANQEAIARDIQVVNFPVDPFNRVIAPAQWRAK